MSNLKSGVLIIDFGSQYTQLIARRIREFNVFCEIRSFKISLEEIKSLSPKSIILSGGPATATEAGAPSIQKELLTIGIPVLGICYGMQLIAHSLGAKVGAGESREYGPSVLEVVNSCAIFEGFDNTEKTPVWMSHGDHVESLPTGFVSLASSHGAPIAAFGSLEKKIFGIQFHPEVVHTPRGREILSNFVIKISGCSQDWTSGNFIDESISKVRDAVGDGTVVCALSGGVDSTVAAVLIDRAIGKKLHCIFVDNGLLRKHERERIAERLGDKGLGLNLTVVDAADRFLSALEGVSDPEQKRKIIGRVFIEVFDDEARRIGGVTHLVQGTLYPDVIESVSVRGGPSVTIKTHHNVGGLPEQMKLKLVEPFRELFKDEVRAIGRELGVPDEIVKRQPFPGPGLAVRCLGDITAQKLTMLREADQIFSEEVLGAGLYNSLWQSFCVLLPVKSVGVMGDGRTYENTIGLRAVTSEDGMTADWAYLPEELLRKTSNRIINEVKGINRVVLDISSKPPATIEWE